MQLVAAGDPGAVLADLDHGDEAGRLGGEAAGEGGVVVAGIWIQGADLVLVCEDVAQAAGAELAEHPVARGVHDLEGGDVERDGGAGGAGAGERGVGEGLVEDEVALYVGVAHAGEIGGGDLGGREGEGGAEVGAHGARGVGRDEGEAAGVGQAGAGFEAGEIEAEGGGVVAVGARGGVGAEFAEERGALPEAGGHSDDVGGAAARGEGGWLGQAGDEGVHLGGVHQDHAALVAAQGGEEGFRDACGEVHDGGAESE